MKIKPSTAKLVEMQTRLDPEAVPSSVGPVLWATVRLDYVLAGLSPSMTIRVPVAWDKAQTEEERAAHALRNARLLIDHACQHYGAAQEDAAPEPVRATDMMLPSALEGLTQELGLTKPTTSPGRAKR